ncbi:DUF86 domain-containing protein [Paenibacillus thalictri]|uniref:DUF86 domain-containing protein n=1 Tax=Paenibacillus thalictri TaxID=2527873 RepID=A0A4Q9DZ77_9BACL|nr:HepT-like ribonuclease domain-containing protein [Paenibacillus thalictri]TBL81153.1 DUF86 domain-containing protein [Paenibacillus thalictri]
MYYINEKQIEERLHFIEFISSSLSKLSESWDAGDPLKQLAQERVLHLAIETVTDVGSLLIDAFMMRDASSYEDIVDILAGEGVFSQEVAAKLSELVKLRKPLIQEYVGFPRERLQPVIAGLPDVLREFAAIVPVFIRKEMI